MMAYKPHWTSRPTVSQIKQYKSCELEEMTTMRRLKKAYLTLDKMNLWDSARLDILFDGLTHKFCTDSDGRHVSKLISNATQRKSSIIFLSSILIS